MFNILWFNQFVQIVLFSGIICVGGDGIINEVSHLRWSFLFISDEYSTIFLLRVLLFVSLSKIWEGILTSISEE